jgi:hypothetical protein
MNDLKIKLPEEEYLGLIYTPNRARRYKEAEKEASGIIDGAVNRGIVDSGLPPLGWLSATLERDAWFEAVFDMSELELIEAVNVAARRYKWARRRPWRRRVRREAEADYIRHHCRLRVSHGLETSWS